MKQKKGRIWTAIFLAAVMSAAFCACDGNGDKGDDDVSTGSATIEISSPEGVVYPYIDRAKAYLEAPFGEKNVGFYRDGSTNPGKGVVLSWECDADDVQSQTLVYGTKSDYSDGISVTLDKNATSYDLYNLYKGTTYYWKVTANLAGDKTISATSSFQTTDLGPRVMTIDGIYNVRDLGGYVVDSGKTTKQGLVYRGGALLPASGYDSQLTTDGKIFMSETLGIKTDLDLRGSGSEAGGIVASPIPNAELVYIKTDGYTGAFSLKENFRRVFSLLSNENNYPVYMHCTGGADRTGTVAFLLNALLGVSERDLIHDYEFTTFSIYGERNSLSGQYGEAMQILRNTLDTYEGDTLAEKTASYMRSIGVMQTEIDNIRAIMLGEETVSVQPDMPTVVADEYLPFTDGVLTLDHDTASVMGTKAVGYDTIVKMNIQTTLSSTNGGIWVFIGSYGIHLRGGTWRAWTTTDGLNFTELSPRVELCACYVETFSEGSTLYYGLKVVDETTVRAELTVECPDGSVIVGSCDFVRLADEIASENACITVGIRTDQVTSMTVTAG